MNRSKRPVDPRSRERLRQAQQQEADALTLVDAAIADTDRAEVRLAAVVAGPQRAVDEAAHRLACARAGLAEVSGAKRAALLLDVPLGVVRADVRAVRRDKVSDQCQGSPADSARAPHDRPTEQDAPVAAEDADP